jgi:hypothetical protein
MGLLIYIMDILSNLCDPAQLAAIIGGIYLVKVFYSASSVRSRPNLLPIMAVFFVIVIGVISIVNYSCDSTTNYIAWGLVGLLAVYLVNRLMRK